MYFTHPHPQLKQHVSVGNIFTPHSQPIARGVINVQNILLVFLKERTPNPVLIMV